MLGTPLTVLVTGGMFVLARRADLAYLFAKIRLVPRLAFASSAGQVPFSVAFAQVRGRPDLLRVLDALSRRLVHHGHLTSRGRRWEVSEVDGGLRTRDVIDLKNKRSLVSLRS